jgi:glycosyltransferase involved in cell wall biosynthesis
MKIAVYAIAKNEEQFVKRFCDSAKDADVIVIADTGSTDKTVKVAKQCGAKVYEIFISPWRFDRARDASLALVPKDVDVCLSLDLDEVLLPGWREEIERLWEDGTTQMNYRFDGGSGLIFYQSKIHKRTGYQWKFPCHEYLNANVNLMQKTVYSERVMIIHQPDNSKSRGQYLDMLDMAVREDPKCQRSAFYYARELFYKNNWQTCIDAFKRYLDLPDAVWAAERSFAMRHIGIAYEEMGQDGLHWLRKAAVEEPGIREPWYELARAFYKKRMWQDLYAAASMCLSITEKVPAHTMNPASWGFTPHDLMALAAYNLGLKNIALKHGEIAVEMEPNDQRLIDNLKYYRE